MGQRHTNSTGGEIDGSHDFDFLVGTWEVQNCRLKTPFNNGQSWYEFNGRVVVRPLWGSKAQVEEYEADSPSGHIQGMTLRLYDPKSKQWRLYWANSMKGSLEVPLTGEFRNGRGEFFDQEIFEGKAIYVRYLWSDITANSCKWEQAFSIDGGKSWEPNWRMELTRAPESQDYPVIELRRYTVKETERNSFARYFESYFPEAFQQLGAMIFGQFLERGNPRGFTWIRGFHDMAARATVNWEFYGGPLWKEHGPTMNARLFDHTNVLLLKPLHPERGITVSPPVDPIREPDGARGVVIAQIFAVKPNGLALFSEQAEATFALYRTTGVQEAGVLVTLDVPNNYPRLPFRTDGPYLVWLGVVKDTQVWETRLKPLMEHATDSLATTDLLRGKPELVLLDPSHRSRLRWLPD